MALFSFIAGVLVGVAAVRVALLLCRSAALPLRRSAYVRAGVLVASFAVAAGILYLAIGSRHGLERPGPRGAASAGAAASTGKGAAGTAKSMDAEVAGLEARLAREGGTPADWSLLAQAYDFMGRPEDARRARAKTGAPAASPAVWQMGASALSAAASAADTRPAVPASARNDAGATASAVSASAAELERRVAANPRDAQSWLALAELRRGQRDYAGSRTAYLKLVDLRAMSAQSWADYADVLGSLAGGSLAGDAGRAIDNALALDAANPKALWLKASQANEQRRYAEALGWWKKLRAVLPPDSPDAHSVDANIAEAITLAGGQAPAAPTATAAAANTGAGAEVSGTVSLD